MDCRELNMMEDHNLKMLATVAATIDKGANQIPVGSKKRKQSVDSIRQRLNAKEVQLYTLEDLSSFEAFMDIHEALGHEKKNNRVQHIEETKSNCELFHRPAIPDCMSIDSAQSLSTMSIGGKKKGELEPSIFNDHCYSILRSKGVAENLTVLEGELSTEKVTIQRVLPQFIITTPPFPYVHGSSEIQVASKCEIRHNGEPVDYKPEIIVDPVLYSNRVISSEHAKEKHLTSSKKISKTSNKIDVTGSVLECVENRVNIKLCQPSTSKGINFNLDNNFENLENLQKTNTVKRRTRETHLTLPKKKKGGGSELLSCNICNATVLMTLTSLFNHCHSHAVITPFSCILCNKTCTRMYGLKYHISVHLNTSRFTCSYCQRRFRHLSHFREHLRRHTGETPYGCPDCGKRFTTRNTYKRHMFTVHRKVLMKHGIRDLITDDTPKV